MKHLGDITKINGAEIPVVDVITGGSPCQDLSVAGKRAGLDGERSGLFMEQIRIVKEMRERDRRDKGSNFNVRPRFMVWENVPGAFSSNGGKDFQAVLSEIVRIVEPDAPDVPMPPKRWSKAGCLYDELGRWSIAWRVHDAQFWGVPQRRKRIALVADFGGLAAPEVCFERKCLSGDFAESREEGQGIAGAAGEGTNRTISFQERAVKPGGGKGILIQHEKTGALSTFNNQSVYDAYQHHGWRENETIGTMTRDQNNGVRGDTPLVVDARGNGNGEIAPTITGDHQNRVTDYTAITYSNEAYDKWAENESGASLRATGGCYGGGSESLIQEKTGALMASGYNKPGTQEAANGMFVTQGTVRRLTPMECERLQGFPDGWTDIGEWTDSKGKLHKPSDSPRYKALGNSIALPFWFYLLRRISAQYERPATLGSLFDGIGGFPLCWERCNGKGSAIWASEIEEFPIAVTKRHFPEGEE